MAKVIAVFGLSGVGKSWMISRFTANTDVAHVQASHLMRDAIAARSGTTVTSEDLRRGTVLDNQAILVDAFSRTIATETRPIIFDGHCLVDAGDSVIEIPPDVIRQIMPAGIILIHAAANEIVTRRQNDISRHRPDRSAAELAAQQERCVKLCAEYGHGLGVEFAKVQSGDEDGFARTLRRLLLP
jgi:adenylate kinase